ncbi:MAG TPA: site-specific integrase [Kineosporiaceae bacterium]|nr:site-specific integrase [Kineosporiaceae bacterium]
MGEGAWQLFFTRRGLPRPGGADPVLAGVADLDGWLDREGVREGTPFLIDPAGCYDVALNGYFLEVLGSVPVHTQRAVAYDLKRFLAFLWENRGATSWRQASPEDRAAFQRWRRVDPGGPRVAAATWDREVATVNQFYAWAVRTGLVAANPIVARQARRGRAGVRAVTAEAVTTPAEATHQGSRRDVAWLPPRVYQRWRDVGVRGFGTDGLPDPGFRGRYAGRNAAFSDLLIRTGLRLSEATSLSLFELPSRVAGVVHARTWLPAAIAKGGSARAVYVPDSVLADVWEYVECERADAVARARVRGVYEQIPDPLIVADAARPVVVIGGRRVGADRLDGSDRRRLLVATSAGLEPAAVWLTEAGVPSAASGWQQVFKNANRRCVRLGVGVSCHPHMLRHSFAVITLEQLWRGHLQDLAEMTPTGRATYQMVFGDPLNWVRIRLGHRSVVTTQIYLHTLQELEMATRMALVPDGWELPDRPSDDGQGHEDELTRDGVEFDAGELDVEEFAADDELDLDLGDAVVAGWA